jgi:hypothetical protein
MHRFAGEVVMLPGASRMVKHLRVEGVHPERFGVPCPSVKEFQSVMDFEIQSRSVIDFEIRFRSVRDSVVQSRLVMDFVIHFRPVMDFAIQSRWVMDFAIHF